MFYVDSDVLQRFTLFSVALLGCQSNKHADPGEDIGKMQIQRENLRITVF